MGKGVDDPKAATLEGLHLAWVMTSSSRTDGIPFLQSTSTYALQSFPETSGLEVMEETLSK